MTPLEKLLRAVANYAEEVGQTPINHIESDSEATEALRNALHEVMSSEGSRPAGFGENTEFAADLVGNVFAHFMGLELYTRNRSGEDTTDLIATKFKEAVVLGIMLGYELGTRQTWDGLDVGECMLELID